MRLNFRQVNSNGQGLYEKVRGARAMISYGHGLPMDASCPRYVVADELEWLNLMARMRRNRADASVAPIPVAPVAMPRRAPIEKNEVVRTQRDLIVGKHLIASGSVGTVTALHARRPLVEVAFFVGERVSVTLAGYELLRATA